jgi:hypothetical protein
LQQILVACISINILLQELGPANTSMSVLSNVCA